VVVISDTETGTKIPLASCYLLPHATVLDPRMMLTLPALVTAATAMDALTHAVEAYTSLAANPMSDAYATVAIQKINRYLLAVMDNPQDSQGRLELAQASTMAGIAFSNSSVGMVHALGHSPDVDCRVRYSNPARFRPIKSAPSRIWPSTTAPLFSTPRKAIGQNFWPCSAMPGVLSHIRTFNGRVSVKVVPFPGGL